jgi:hypothetical protein
MLGLLMSKAVVDEVLPGDSRPFYEAQKPRTRLRRGASSKDEGQVASGLHHGPQTERTRFEDLVDGIRRDMPE